MYLTVSQAAKTIGKSRSAISRAIKAEKLPAKKDKKGQWKIKPENLLQVFPEADLEKPLKPLSEAPRPAGRPQGSRPESLEQEVQWLREQLRQQTKQEQENHRELVRLLKQEAEERLRLSETLAAPLEQEVQQLRQELNRAQEKIRELRSLLSQGVEERQRLVKAEPSNSASSESQGFWSRWFNK